MVNSFDEDGVAKIEEDAKNLTALYEEAVSVCDQAYLDGKITKEWKLNIKYEHCRTSCRDTENKIQFS